MSPERLDEQMMAVRVAKEFRDGMVVNLGFGIPTFASSFVPDGVEITIQSENGVLGIGRLAVTEEEQDFDLVNASGQFATPLPGMSFFDHAESFSMIRGGHIDLCILGGLQVSERGDLANWLIPGREPGSIGGAMDLASGATRLIVVMTHTTKDGELKVLKKCSYALTAPECVKRLITDIAVIDVVPEGLVLRETAPGWSVAEVQKLTEPKLIIPPDLKEMEL
jgi:3-oxoacid CoA-transferase subunit B